MKIFKKHTTREEEVAICKTCWFVKDKTLLFVIKQ